VAQGAGQINQDANGRIDVNLKAAAGTNVTLDANNVLNVSTKIPRWHVADGAGHWRERSLEQRHRYGAT
jgi:hypothetical protein